MADHPTASRLTPLDTLGTPETFDRLAARHRPELLTHAYRMLGSVQDAEDAVQDAMLRAWRARGSYDGRAPVRAWLYGIVTNVCLDVLRQRKRRIMPAEYAPAAATGDESPHVVTEVLWLEPFPDSWLDASAIATPDAVYGLRESISLAFLEALQHLPPRQRAVLLLRDVVGWSAVETARALELSVPAVTSALQRARTTVRSRYSVPRDSRVDATAGDLELVTRYVAAWEDGDLQALLKLLREDIVVSMPPDTLWFKGRATLARFVQNGLLAGDARGRVRLVPVGANLQPAFVLYIRDPDGAYQPLGIMVLTIDGSRVSAITGFMAPSLLPYFSVPASPLP